ncbi:DUF2955 domain-containing protein [Vibrio parahaemolyticus]|nr:DUF2955 domain-containing protein [Vibrio parahaemolyticus]ELB2164012.1 DUF2955 domain-containing protein [Vibrio parahaemolyticus]ELB2187462.1 DUF2955 domain-containing protein [Vibrio parahaemolyticus]ELB2192433.1 DUF2955 domain-containing protein [Vibrio parahaemolyticus]ELB2212594.1 DUF2955 domain-containing protein [Vibrio parahaemolyticus]
MFRSSVNPVLKIVFAPILLLFYLKYIGQPLPMLGPMFVVILLTTLPSNPPLKVILQLLVVVLFVSFVVVFFASMFSDTPTGYLLFCWSLFCWSYYRSHTNPQDIISTLTLIVVVIVTVLSKQMEYPISGVPVVIFQGLLIAMVVTWFSHLLFPGEQTEIEPDEGVKGGEAHLGLAIFKATAMYITLETLIGVGSSQTMLIAITISSMIKLPMVTAQREFVSQRLVTTATGMLFTLPIMFLYAFGAPNWVVLGITLFLGIQLACYAMRRQSHSTIYQLLFTNFTIITYQIIKQEGIDSFSSGFTRLVSIVVAIFIGALILRLIKSRVEMVE